MADEPELLRILYRDFNTRRMEEVLGRMHSDVIWPNRMEGGEIHGVDGVRDYWTRQWAMLDPHVEPVDIRSDGDGRYVVDVHQVVRDREGKLLDDRMVVHVYRIREGKIERMDVE